MCRCCQSCLEDCYWNCIEEKFCYDENIALYDPDEDEYNRKKSNGFFATHNNDGNLVPPGNNNYQAPICSQPGRLQRHCSTISTSKIHEDEFHREIQTTVPILAPEIISVFATSQIFHDHHEHKNTGKSPSTVKFATGALPSVHTPKSSSRKALEVDADKLLARLEDNSSSNSLNRKQKKIFTITEESDFDSQQSLSSDLSEKLTFNKVHDEPIVLRNKNLTRVESEPNYLKHRPASENDIFIISKSSQFSMTPEIPSISYSTLPKNYADTPTIEKYRESTSLYSIQTANQNKSMDFDYSMPRYFRKSDLFTNNSLDNVNNTTNNINVSNQSINNERKKTMEKSKRLKMLRNSLPPLMIHTTSLKEKTFRDGHNTRH